MRFWPLAIFVALVGFLVVGLYRDPREVPSPLINKPAPGFTLAQVDEATRSVSRDQLLGKVYLINFFASWCVPCREEHPLLVDFARRYPFPIYGIDYKDSRAEALGLLAQSGNPYKAALFDGEGRVGIDFGITGVPESFVVDKKGVIRFKQPRPFTEDEIMTTLLPLMQQLERES